MNQQNNSDVSRKELDELSHRYRNLYRVPEEDRETVEAEILEAIIDWGKKNSGDLGYLFQLAQGKGASFGVARVDELPLLYIALGKIGNPDVVPLFKELLRSCSRKRICLYANEMFQALISINDSSAVNAISDLLKKPKKSNLTAQFLNAIKEVPSPNFLPILIRIAESGITYQLDLILAKMSVSNRVPFLDYLESKNKHVRWVAVEALRISENAITPEILASLKKIANKKNEDILTRSYAADILKESGMEVPSRFRDRVDRNISNNLERFVEGLIFPEKRSDSWALEEIVDLRYDDDMVRIQLRFSIMPFAEIRIWRGCFWDVFKMGFSFSKPMFSGGRLKVIGMTRATNFESEPFEIEYLTRNLDRILERLVNQIVESRGESYKMTMETINQAIRSGSTLLIKGQQTWEVDWDKIEKQGGC